VWLCLTRAGSTCSPTPSLLTLVKGRLPVFGGITGSTPEETRDLALALRRVMDHQNYAGQVFLADLPLWYHSNRGLPQFYQGLLEETGLPLFY